MKNHSEYISPAQLFVLIHLFEIGSTVVIGIGGKAEQNAWLAVLTASLFGVVLVFIYDWIIRLSPGKNVGSAFTFLLGKKIGKTIVFLYCVYFIYIAARVLRDFIEIVHTAIYPRTPVEFIALMFVLVIMYYLNHGLEVSARAMITFMPYLVIFLFIMVLFLWVNQSIQLDKIRPVLAEGLKPLVVAIFPGLMTFPFGEIVVFLFLACYLQHKNAFWKVGAGALLFSGIVLSFFAVIQTAVLGVEFSAHTSFPLLSAVRRISLAEFLERLDALVVFVLLIGIFIKVLLFTLAALKGIEYISSLPYRLFIVPFGGMIALFSIVIADNYAEHLEEGLKLVPLYLHLPLQYGVPILVLVGLWGKKKLGEWQG